jgi:hypothetical protein
MKTFSWLVFGLVLVLATGCASSSDAPAAATTGPPANVAGNWNGGFYGALSNSVSMQLQQQGTAVTGTIDVGGWADLNGPITGTVRGNMMDYRLANGGAGTMQVSGNVISGTISGNAFRAQKQ